MSFITYSIAYCFAVYTEDITYTYCLTPFLDCSFIAVHDIQCYNVVCFSNIIYAA